MHEMSIAGEVLEAVRTEWRRYPGTTPLRLGLRIGALAGVDPESLRFCLEALVKETELDKLHLEIEFCPRRERCRSCATEFNVDGYEIVCPACAGTQTDCVGGEELELAYLEVEEYEPSAARR